MAIGVAASLALPAFPLNRLPLCCWCFMFLFCTAIDECSAETRVCSGGAHCTNTTGSYKCTCNPGFSHDGLSCRGTLHTHMPWQKRRSKCFLLCLCCKEKMTYKLLVMTDLQILFSFHVTIGSTSDFIIT